MAQVILSTIGTALGGPIGGFIGSGLGHALDQTALNALSPTRQIGRKISGLALNQSSLGDPIKQVFGKARISATIIWAARLKENRKSTKATKNFAKTESFSYSLSFAIALCEGPIDGIGRIWADGQLLDQTNLAYRLYLGTENQTPDPLIEAIEGNAPSYRGLAYMVFEDLNISEFGNRVPNISVEIYNRPKGSFDDMESLITGVNLIPGAGEFVYATTPYAVLTGLTHAHYENLNTGSGKSDFETSLEQLQAQLPNVNHVNLIISWFGDDLRCSQCQIKPGVETRLKFTTPKSWSVSGLSRSDAHLISTTDDRPNFGGTPSDDTVIEAITMLKARGISVCLVPFILMDIAANNTKPDPYGAAHQAAFPWRGRITCDIAPHRLGSEDQTSAIDAHVSSFMGVAQASNFKVTASAIDYSGPSEWGLRRFVLHLAALAKRAGGVESVLIGSELRGLTTLRSGANSYPMVAALKNLAQEVRTLVGSGTKISYAADWSEYFGHQPADGSNHLAFHLDPLWSDSNIDFVGIDWYAPLSDWREGTSHLDYQNGFHDIKDQNYLQNQIRGGEGFDYYYLSEANRQNQVRTQIIDTAHAEDWVFRPKDLKNWWLNSHYERPLGVRATNPTQWVAQSKPIRIVEYGCASIDKGANAPNLFLDPKSSESAIPPYSTGERDDAMSRAFVSAMASFYNNTSNNPQSLIYHAPMMDKMAVWCWDARPYPEFPQKSLIWGDAQNWTTGHWLNGRVGAGDVKNLISNLMQKVGIAEVKINVDQASGAIDGYVIEQPMSCTQALAPVLAYLGLDLADRASGLAVIAASNFANFQVLKSNLVYENNNPQLTRRDLSEVPASLNLRAYDAHRDYQQTSIFVRKDNLSGANHAAIDLPLCLSVEQALDFANYSLNRLHQVRETISLDLEPLDLLRLEIGDVLTLEEDPRLFRVLRVDNDETPSALLEEMQIPRNFIHNALTTSNHAANNIAAPIMTGFIMLELPPFGADEDNFRPVLIAFSDPFSNIDVYAGPSASSLRFVAQIDQKAGRGKTLSALSTTRADYLLENAFVDIYLEGDAPKNCTKEALFMGENYVCILAQNSEWEIVQFLNSSLIGNNMYRLSGLVRGQWGTTLAMKSAIAVGADVVILGDSFARGDMSVSEIGQSRLYRAGRAGFGGAKQGSFESNLAWQGLALRPRAPVHGRYKGRYGYELYIKWTRCARFGGDSWEFEPPLCEEQESYQIRFYQGENLRRTIEVNQSSYVYSVADQAIDYPNGFDETSYSLIAQRSQSFGLGEVMRLDL